MQLFWHANVSGLEQKCANVFSRICRAIRDVVRTVSFITKVAT